jgi:hypothetical protein
MSSFFIQVAAVLPGSLPNNEAVLCYGIVAMAEFFVALSVPPIFLFLDALSV